MKQHDATLLAAAGNGDVDAFEQIYRVHKDDMITAAMCVLGGDGAAAEDVLHDVFIALAKRAGRLQLRDSLRNYLLTSCINRARDILRRRVRTHDLTDGLVDERSEGMDPSGVAHLSEESARLLETLALLPVEQREVVTLHIHGQMKFREISQILGISINTAKSRYRYALAALRTMLADKEMDKEKKA